MVPSLLKDFQLNDGARMTQPYTNVVVDVKHPHNF